jgi:hypothetical protein
MKIKIILVAIMCLSVTHAFAQIDTINIAKNDLTMSQLKEGVHQYLVFFENAKKKKILSYWLWTREVKFSKLNNEPVIEINQKWHSSDTAYYREVYSVSRQRNFSPLFHLVKSPKGREGFMFTDTEVSAADTVKENKIKDLKKTLETPTLNWELDLEIFSTLPFKKEGQRFMINFYHPGGSEPKYYEYKVIGSEKIAVADSDKIDCWKLQIEYNADSWAIFWISKKSKEVLKMQESYKGNYRYKVKLSTTVSL